jgi:hypothetical protein
MWLLRYAEGMRGHEGAEVIEVLIKDVRDIAMINL